MSNRRPGDNGFGGYRRMDDVERDIDRLQLQQDRNRRLDDLLYGSGRGEANALGRAVGSPPMTEEDYGLGQRRQRSGAPEPEERRGPRFNIRQYEPPTGLRGRSDSPPRGGDRGQPSLGYRDRSRDPYDRFGGYEPRQPRREPQDDGFGSRPPLRDPRSPGFDFEEPALTRRAPPSGVRRDEILYGLDYRRPQRDQDFDRFSSRYQQDDTRRHDDRAREFWDLD